VVLTAVLFYFGWARVRATYAYFGVDVSVLNFSASDYVLRSVSTAFPPLVAAGLLAIGAVLVHDQLRSNLAEDSAFAGRLVNTLLAIGWGLVAVGFILALVITGQGGSAPPGPAVMMIGFAVIVYALFLRDRYVVQNGSPIVVIIAGLLTLSFFWSVTAYANYIGVQAAMQLQSNLPAAANVVVYSSSNLSLTGPGITQSMPPDSVYRFRYSGLRLLASSGGQYFLLPEGWRPGNGPVIALPVAPLGIRIRVQFEAPAS
jgi:hypothetical protein